MKQMNLPLPTLGVDVLSNELSITAGAVRKADNVMLDRDGQPTLRQGFVRKAVGARLHSLYAVKRANAGLLMDSNKLMALNPETLDMVEVGQMPTDDLADYTEANGNIYITNQTATLFIPSNSSQARACGIPQPPLPVLSEGDGSLGPGKYGVVITYVDDRAEESPASELAVISLTEPGGIMLSGLELGDRTTRVYITSADGDVLRQAEQFAQVFPTYLVGSRAEGGECMTQHLRPLPGGEFIRSHNGRMYVARVGEIVFSEAFRPHLYNPAYNRIPIVGIPRFMEPVVGGIFYGDARGVHFLRGGDPTKFVSEHVSTCRAVSRSSIMVPGEHFDESDVGSDSPVALWLSTSGYTVGLSNGETKELHPDRIKVQPGLTGRSVFYMQDGRKHVITPVNSTSTAVAEAAVDSDLSL